MNKFLNRAKYIDEPFVRHRLEQLYPNSRFSLGDIESDWEHADVEMTTQSGVSYKIDVKRPLPKYLNSPNFTFIFYKNDKVYPLDGNGYIAFIDDKTGDIYLVSYSKMKNYISKFPNIKNIPGIKYIILSKQFLVTDNNTIIKGNKSSSDFLIKNSNPEDFCF